MTKQNRFSIVARATEQVATITRRGDDWPDWYGYTFVLVILVASALGFSA